MAKKATTTTKARAGTKLNPYPGWYVAAKIRGRVIAWKGAEVDMRALTEDQLERLSQDRVYGKYVKRKPGKSSKP